MFIKNQLKRFADYITMEIWKKQKELLKTTEARIKKDIGETIEGRLKESDQAIAKRIDLSERRFQREVRGAVYDIMFRLQKRGILSAPKQTASVYDDMFYSYNRYNSVLSAVHIFRILLAALPVKSMVDFGCGTGTWLYAATRFGVSDVLGVDGEYIDTESLMIRENEFIPCDIGLPVKLEKRYDLCLSVEVAEHLPEGAADAYVENLCAASDMVLFSAAHPGQGGDDHFNEQPMSYWEEKFSAKAYQPIQIKKLFSGDFSIGFEYRSNLILFVKEHVWDDISLKISQVPLPKRKI